MQGIQSLNGFDEDINDLIEEAKRLEDRDAELELYLLLFASIQLDSVLFECCRSVKRKSLDFAFIDISKQKKRHKEMKEKQRKEETVEDDYINT